MKLAIAAALLTGPIALVASAQTQGPSSSQSPYVVPLAAGVQTVSILTVGDTVGGYTLAGIPDGMGAFGLAGGEFQLLVNHEISSSLGAVRAHGAAGSFVSKWQINRTTLAVSSGADLIQTLNLTSGSPALNRLCSGDLPKRTAFFLNSNVATAPQIFLSGEEAGAEGRAFAHIASGAEAGTSHELPALGNFSWENAVARPHPSRLTVVAGLDDSTPGQVYFYVGSKQRVGSTIERAGLAQGTFYGVRVPGIALEDRLNGLSGVNVFELASLGDASGLTGAQIQSASTAAGVTEFLRPEDGAWDPADPRVFYFVTTDRFNTAPSPGRSRLWRLTFALPNAPELGGSIEMLLDGTEGQQMFDNLCHDGKGHLLLQEDPGNQAYLARIWQYDVASDSLLALTEADPVRFVSGGGAFLTQDEEVSGIFDASSLIGPGWFVFNTQAHYSIPGALVEGGQILALFNPDSL